VNAIQEACVFLLNHLSTKPLSHCLLRATISPDPPNSFGKSLNFGAARRVYRHQLFRRSCTWTLGLDNLRPDTEPAGTSVIAHARVAPRATSRPARLCQNWRWAVLGALVQP
jgi:hypothetical protein